MTRGDGEGAPKRTESEGSPAILPGDARRNLYVCGVSVADYAGGVAELSRDAIARRTVWSFVVDVVLVVAFAVIGRASHAEALDAAGVATTAWPFLVALVVGWAVTLAWRAPVRPVRTGLPLWAITLVGGMLLRVLSGQGTAVPFIVVAAVFLLITLVGWRVVTTAVTRARARGRGIHSPE